jgi:(p)ppGpp synthase/HD superfamily hydrolase
MTLLEQAISLAVLKHAGQTQKNGDPYVLHPLHLMCQMRTEDERIVAVLHDVVEDTDVTLDELAQMGFSAIVLEALDLLTHDPDVDYADYVAAIRPNPLARRIKMADLRHNMDILRLATITDRDVERLRKYRHAWDQLHE